MLGFNEFIRFDSYGRIVWIQLRPETHVGFCTSKARAHAKQEQLVRFGMLRPEFIARVFYERFVGDTRRRVKFHRTRLLEVHRLEPVRVTFSLLAVRHFELWNFYPEVRFVDDVRTEKTFAVTQCSVEGAIHFELPSRLAARPSQVGDFPVSNGGGCDGRQWYCFNLFPPRIQTAGAIVVPRSVGFYSLNLGSQHSEVLRVTSECLRLEIRCSLHLTKEIPNGWITALRSGLDGGLGGLRSKLRESGRPALCDEREIN